jgi:4-amino-4-deoxy-L-arabinose transferase-like glycosyltransferase
LVLGLGYLAKAFLFPMGFIFLALALAIGTQRPRRIAKPLLSLVVFLLVASPLVLVLSAQKGRFTFSDAGKLNYVWHVNKVKPWVHWQGGPEGAGTPVHPVRKLSEQPVVYEFSQPVKGTYPAFQDPSYWYEGVEAEIDLSKLLSAIVENGKSYYHIFLQRQGGIIACLILVFAMGGTQLQSARAVLRQWPLVIPGVLALLMYWLVYVKDSYVAPFIVLVWMGLLLGVRTAESTFHRKLASAATILIIAMTLISVLLSMGRSVVDEEKSGPIASTSSHKPWVVSEGLKSLGLRAGDKVATLGFAWAPYWARLARLQIVAELPKSSYLDYWAADEKRRGEALDRMAGTGARAVVCTGDMPSTADASGWLKIPATDWHVMFLENQPPAETQKKFRQD